MQKLPRTWGFKKNEVNIKGYACLCITEIIPNFFQRKTKY